MAELIGIRLQLTGATQVAGGLSQITDALQDTAAQAGTTGAALKTLGAQAVTGVQATQSATQAVQQQLRASARETDAQANMLRQANRNLSMQMTDIVTSLTSGMPAHMVLLQQGGQIKDAYGGVLDALKGVGSYLATLATPVNLAAGAIAALGVAAFKGSQEVDAYTRALTLTGNQIGMTEGELAQMAARIDNVAGTTSKAAEVLAQLAGTAGITRDSIERIGTASIAMERAGGPSVQELAKKFAALGEKPLEALVKINEAENFLTESIYLQVKALMDQGREAEAAALAQETYAQVTEERTKRLESQLGYLERAWRGVKEFAAEAWDAMLGLGRKDTDEQRLEDLRKQLDDRLKAQAGARSDNRARYQPGIDLLKQQIAEIEKSLRLQKEQDELRQKDLDRAKARAAWDQERTKFLTQEKRLEEEIARIRKLGAEAGISKADIEARVRAARERLAPRSSSTRSGQKVSSVTELGDIDALREAVALLEEGLELSEDVNDERERGTRLQRDEQKLIEQYTRTVDSVGDALANALLTGGMEAGQALKRYFSTLILQPIIQALVNPVARTIVGGLGLAGAAGSAAAGSAAGASGGAATGLGALLATGSAYGSLFGAGASMALSGGTSAALAAANAAMQGGSVGAGLSIGAGAIAPWVAAGALIISGLSRKLKDTGIRGSFGGTEGFAGNQYAFYKGGFLRSDRTRLSALDPDTQALLAGGFNELRTTTTAMARELGLAADALDGYTKSIDISLRGLTQDQIAERLGKELGVVADEMARLVAGAGASAQSLQQLYQAVMSERAQLETRLLQLQGDTAELRRRERDALHESNRALYDRIIALEGERAALDALLSDTASLIQQQIGASQAAANAARQAADAYRTAGMTLIDTARALRGEVSPGASAAAAYRSALGAAQGGDVGAMQALPGLAQAYAESLRGSARSRAQYLAGTRGIAAELEAVAGTAGGLGTTASIEAALLDVNTAVLRNLAEDVQNGALTVELLREHQTLLDRIASRLGDTGPLAERIDANVGATGNVIDAQLVAGDVLASSDSTLSRVLAKLSEPDANAAMLSQHVQSGNALLASRLDLVVQAISAQAAAQQAEIKRQQDLLKTQADLESAAAYFQTLQQNLASTQQTLASTSTTVQTRIGTEPWYKGKGGIYRTDPNPAYATALDSVSAAQEALSSFAPQLDLLREQIRNLGGVPAFAAGGLHSGGLRLVGERGPELEVTGPARYWSAADTTAMLGNSTRREELLAAEIRALRAEVAGLRAETRATAENTGKTRRLWERVTRDGESMQVTDVTPTP